MPYKVVNRFVDTVDNNTPYEIGEDFPKGDYVPSQERIDQLSAVHPKYNRVFIESIKDESDTGSSKLYSQTELKKLNKSDQEKIITELSGDITSVKNEEERIALILHLQGVSNTTPTE
jgi:hypothetical protein